LLVFDVRPQVRQSNCEARKNQADGLLILTINLLDPTVAIADQHSHGFRKWVDDPVFAQTISQIFGSPGHVVALVRFTALRVIKRPWLAGPILMVDVTVVMSDQASR
jgi:hypothetical protein